MLPVNTILQGERYKLLLGDFREIGKEIEDNSIDMIFTDPEYSSDKLPLYGDLADFAARVLKEGGRLITYTNTGKIPEICALLTTRLSFTGIFGIHQHGQLAILYNTRIMCTLKFLLLYVKGKFSPPTLINNYISTRHQGKAYHPWQQSTIEAAYLISHLTKKGDTILDPMMGSGTSGIAALGHGRKFIGIDQDPKAFKTAEERLSATIYQVTELTSFTKKEEE